MKRWIALLLALGMLMSLTACGEKNVADNGMKVKKTPVVGICMPRETPYWAESAQGLVQALQAQGCKTELRWAENDVRTQVRQAGDLVASMVDCLVIAPVDSVALIDVEEEAARADIPVIAYDRLLMDTEAVTAHVTFDYKQMGMDIGSYIIKARQLKTAKEEGRSYTIEFFMGSADDNNALLLHKGILWELNPYLTSGVLVCRTGRVSFEDTYTLRWDAETARQECANYLQNFYTPEQPLDICCAASDELALGCIAALTEAGCTQENWPLVTGHGAGAVALEQMESGHLAVTFQKDVQALAQAGAAAAMAALEGKTPPSNTQQAGDNHVIQVPTWVCGSTLVEARKPEPEIEPEPAADNAEPLQ